MTKLGYYSSHNQPILILQNFPIALCLSIVGFLDFFVEYDVVNACSETDDSRQDL